MERLRKFPKITQVVSGRAYVLKHLSPSMFSVLWHYAMPFGKSGNELNLDPALRVFIFW